jgi:hypothetical protein
MIFATNKLPGFRRTHVEALGGEASYLQDSHATGAREVVLRLVVEHDNPKAISMFAREIGSVGLGFAQGTAGFIGGRPKPTPVVRLFTFFVDKPVITARVQLSQDPWIDVPVPAGVAYRPPTTPPADEVMDEGPLVEVVLRQVAHARSGDKGDSSNIAIFCRRPEYVAHLRAVLTPQRMAQHFSGTVMGKVQRFEAPGLNAFNFLMDQALGGGGMASMRIDPQGKAFVPVPVSWGMT